MKRPRNCDTKSDREYNTNLVLDVFDFENELLPAYVAPKKSTVQDINVDPILKTATKPISIKRRRLELFNKPKLQCDPEFDDEQREKWIRHTQTSKYQGLWNERKRLPIYCDDMLKDILERVSDELNRDEKCIVFLNGIPAAGKTTQLPQYLLDEAIMECRASQTYILVALPNNLSVWALADRVAKERGQEVGDQVGYKTVSDKKLPKEDRGSILFLTYNSLRLWLQENPLMDNVSHVILDEVDERDKNIDKCLRLLKLNFPPKLKVVSISTRDFADIQNYFSDIAIAASAVIDVSMDYPNPTVHYLPDIIEAMKFTIPDAYTTSYMISEPTRRRWHHCPETRIIEDSIDVVRQTKIHIDEDTYSEQTIETLEQWDLEKHPGLEMELIAQLAIHLCQQMHSGEKRLGNILVFMAEYEAIKQVGDRINNLLQEQQHQCHSACVLLLHSKIGDQQKIFMQSQCIKIIIGSNIAETAITIPDVCHVIDCGMTKLTMFDPAKNVDNFRPHVSAQSNTINRARAACRTSCGVGDVYRIFTKETFYNMKNYYPPELNHISLSNELLELKSKGEIPETFFDQLPTPPSPETLRLAAQDLVEIDLANPETDELTKLGQLAYKLLSAAGDLRYAKMLILGVVMSCVEPIVTIVALLSVKDPFRIRLRNLSKNDTHKKISDEIAKVEAQISSHRKQFAKGSHSDLIMFLNIMDDFLSHRSGEQQNLWAYIDFSIMKKIDMKKRRLIKDLITERILPEDYHEGDFRFNEMSAEKGIVRAIICRAFGTSRVAQREMVGEKRYHVGECEAYCQKQSVNNCCTGFRREECDCGDFDKGRYRHIVFSNAHCTGNTTILHHTTAIGPLTLILFGARDLSYNKEDGLLQADGFRFHCEDQTKANQLVAAQKSLEEFVQLQINHLTEGSNVIRSWGHLRSVFKSMSEENDWICTM